MLGRGVLVLVSEQSAQQHGWWDQVRSMIVTTLPVSAAVLALGVLLVVSWSVATRTRH